MAYCINCGVKLGESEKKCPLCQTIVYHPDIPPQKDSVPPFPAPEEISRQKVRPKSGLIIIALLFLLPTLLSVICDLSINHTIVWSGIVIISFFMLSCIVFIPSVFRQRNILWYLIPDFAACSILQLYIERITNGNWFLTFSFPLTCSILIIISLLILIGRFTKCSGLQITAILFIMIGFECFLIEVLLHSTFQQYTAFIWSFYPLTVFIIIGIILFLINRNQRLKERFEKFFFL